MKYAEIIQNVKEVVAEVLEIEDEDISSSASIVNDLDADSLDLVDLSYSLGKKFKIKMPQSSLISQAIEGLGEQSIIVNDKLTALGAAILQAGPNQYSKDEAFEGQTLLAVFGETTVSHWANLCSAIISSGQSGDELFAATVQAVPVEAA